MAPVNVGDGPGNYKKRNDVEIREMEIDDLPAVFHIGENLFTPEQVPNLYRTWDEFEVVGFFNDEPEFCLVAEAQGRIIGFAIGTTITKTRSAWKYGHLVWLGVTPECQRQGIAIKLLNHFRDLMSKEGVRILMVDTDADNQKALDFFTSMGFGHPEGHIYLTVNLENIRRRPMKRPLTIRCSIRQRRKK
jgi:ribosomal protein S18 acetylase RimI-like enzyme